jgi:hypothetical protein
VPDDSQASARHRQPLNVDNPARQRTRKWLTRPVTPTLVTTPLLGPTTNRASARHAGVKVFGIMAIVVVLLFGIMLIAGGGHHGPGRHRHTSGPSGGEALAATVTEVSVLSEVGDL